MVRSSDIIPASVPFFRIVDNFNQWKEQMEVFLEYQEVFDVVEKGIPSHKDATEEEIREAKKKDRKALYFIHQSVEKTILRNIEKVKTAKEAWNKLENIYKPREVRIPILELKLASFGEDPSRIYGETRDKHLNLCHAMYYAAMFGDWSNAETIIEEFPDIVRNAITKFMETPLHIAVASKRTCFVKKLLEKMAKDDLAITDKNGMTAFVIAMGSGDKKMIDLMLEKDPTPTYFAFAICERKTLLYLYDKIDLNTLSSFQLGSLFLSLITSEIYDLALKTFRFDRSLAFFEAEDDSNRRTALDSLVESSYLIKDESWLEFYCNIKFLKIVNRNIIHDVKMKICADQLVREMGKELTRSPETISDFMKKSPDLLFSAAKLGNIEILKVFLRAYPLLIKELENEKGLSLFHIAVINRQEHVFRLIYELKDLIMLKVEDGTNNNMLHLVASLPPSERLNVVPGAGLQMQRELIWFEAVKDIVPKALRRQRNAYGEYPEEIFSRHHRKLKDEGEKWTKKTAQSCMVVATLVATVVFAAAFTVPGGSNQNTGIPILKKQKWFAIFAISDAIALSTSSGSIVLFLSILTSHYADSDFRYSLPLKLVFGLLCLAVSLLAMVLAFGASFFLIYMPKNNQQVSWIPVVNITIALFPSVMFIMHHGRLMVDAIRSTIWYENLFRPTSSKLFPRRGIVFNSITRFIHHAIVRI